MIKKFPVLILRMVKLKNSFIGCQHKHYVFVDIDFQQCFIGFYFQENKTIWRKNLSGRP